MDPRELANKTRIAAEIADADGYHETASALRNIVECLIGEAVGKHTFAAAGEKTTPPQRIRSTNRH